MDLNAKNIMLKLKIAQISNTRFLEGISKRIPLNRLAYCQMDETLCSDYQDI